MNDGDGGVFDFGGEGVEGGLGDGTVGEEGVDFVEGDYVVETNLGVDLVVSSFRSSS